MKTDYLPSASDLLFYAFLCCALALFVLTSVIWIGYGYLGLVTIPVILFNWLSVFALSVLLSLPALKNDSYR